MVRRNAVDGFKWFLKAVDGAPCWDEGGEGEV